jgi:N utilization substance protein B
MGERRRGREYALQMLFKIDMSGTGVEETFQLFWRERAVTGTTRDFAERLVRGTTGNLTLIDPHIRESAEHWRLERMAAVDRNVLRLAVYEFLFEPDVPRVVVIDEAIEMAKRFGGEESSQFINGILDTVRLKLEAAAAVAVDTGAPTDPS